MLHLPDHAVLEVQMLMAHTAGQESGQERVKGFMKLKKHF
jgi:hypothetical protein